jgi:hypothetical protein
MDKIQGCFENIWTKYKDVFAISWTKYKGRAAVFPCAPLPLFRFPLTPES